MKNAESNNKQLLKTGDVARRLNISPNTARYLIRTGKIPSVPILHHKRVDPEALEKYIKQNQVGGH